eukprot:282791_1
MTLTYCQYWKGLMVTLVTLFATICISNGKSFGSSANSNCPTVETMKANLQKLYNDDDPTDFANSLSDDSFMYNVLFRRQPWNKTEFIAYQMGISALVSFYDVSFSNIKIGTNFTQSDIIYYYTVKNGGCTYEINGAFSIFCDAHGKITQDQDFLNEEEVATALYNAVREDGCVSTYAYNSKSASADNSKDDRRRLKLISDTSSATAQIENLCIYIFFVYLLCFFSFV